MKNRDHIIGKILAALQLYDNDGDQSTPMLTAALVELDDYDIGILHGIAGVLAHAARANIPPKWLKQIHGDLLDAFAHLAHVSDNRN